MEDKIHSIGLLNEQYLLIRQLGEGGTSRVYLSVDKNDQSTYVAIKIFRPEFIGQQLQSRDIFVNEITALKMLDHPNIVKMYDYGIKGVIRGERGNLEGLWYIVLEYISERTMINLIKHRNCLLEDIARYFFQQMIDTLIYINSKDIAHSDIKLENMLVNEQYQLKFADFGFASFSKEKQTEQKGTPIYVAPEIIEGLPYDGEKVDVFSSGVCLFAMISGRFPFDCAHVTDTNYRLIIEERYQEFWESMGDKQIKFSDTCKVLIQEMLAYDPKRRIGLKKIKELDWFNELGGYSTSEEVKKYFTEQQFKITDQQTSRGVHPGEAKDRFGEFLVQRETAVAYMHDDTEFILASDKNIADLVEKLNEYCMQRQGKGKEYSVEIVYSDDSTTVKKSIKCKSQSNLELEIMFLHYPCEGQDQGYLSAKFYLKKGNVLRMHDNLAKLKDFLETQGLVEK